jgi:hypothetical protein
MRVTSSGAGGGAVVGVGGCVSGACVFGGGVIVVVGAGVGTAIVVRVGGCVVVCVDVVVLGTVVVTA